MKRKSLLIMLLVALFVPLAMNAQTKTLNSIFGSTKLEKKTSAKEMSSNMLLSKLQPAREAALKELSAKATRAVGDYDLVTSEQIDWSGDYVITAMSSSTSAYVMTGKASGGNYGAYTTVTVNNNSIASSAVDSYKVTLTEVTINNTTYYTIKQGSNYLALTQAGNYLYFVTTDPATQTGNNRLRGCWTISYEDDDYVKITNAYTTTRYIRFNNRSGQQRFACYQSNSTSCLEVSLFKLNDGSCVAPTDFEAIDVDLESATLSWTENGSSQYWVVYYIGENDASTSYEIATSTTFTLTGLTPATTYYALVVPYCGGLDQDSDVIEFTTEDYPCPAPTNLNATNITTNSATLNWTSEAGSYSVYYRPKPEDNIIFEDSFEEGIDNWTTIRNGGGTTSTDWRQYYPSMFTNGGPDCQDGDYAAMSRSWASSAYNVDNWLITPQITLDGTLSFWALDDGEYHEHFDVYVSTGGNAVRDFSLLYEPGNATDTWREITVDLSSYRGQLGYIAIRHQDYDQDYLLIDNFRIYIAGAGSEWIPVSASGNSANLTGLDPETVYEWRIMADCGEDGESLWASSTFTTLSACAAPTGLSSEALTNSATLSWTGYADAYNIQYREATDPTTPATIILTAGDVWGDGSGYQMLLDADATAYGDVFTATSGWTATNYNAFEYLIPTNAECSDDATNIVYNNSVTIQIPAGTYDWCIVNPSPGDRIYIAASNGNVGGRQDDYVFEAGKTYEFVPSMYGSNDGVDVTITDGGNAWIPVSGSVTSPYTLTGLDPETMYEWQVKGDGCDDWSANAYFTTLNGILVESITADDVNVIVGETATITPIVLPTDASNTAVTYTSADETIATVDDNGVVTGVAAGNTTITIAATDGSGVTATINVTVTGIDVTEITADDVNLIVDETATISYTVDPSNATDPSVTFTSADATIATVDESGVVTGVAAGTTTITIASVSNPEVTAIINVTVTSNPNAVQFTVNAPATAQPGDVITVEGVLTAPTNGTYDGFNGLILDITYDNTAFSYVANSMVYGSVVEQAQQLGGFLLPGTLTNAVQLAISVFNEGSFVTAEGVVFSAQFTVLEGAEGSFAFTAEPHGTGNFDHEGTSILYETTPSTVVIAVSQTFVLEIDPYTGEKDNYYLIASPIGTVTAGNVEGLMSPIYDFYSFDQAAENEWINHRDESEYELEPGVGYLYANNTGTDLIFHGIPTTEETKSVDLSFVEAADGLDFPDWNLVGNPFEVDATLDQPFYSMEGGAFVSHTASETLPAMNGAFVVGSADVTSVTFSRNGGDKASKLALNITRTGKLVDRAIVSFNERQQLPKFQLFNNSTKVYIEQDNKDYAVVYGEAQGEMPVSFKTENNGTYTLSFSNENIEFNYLHLIDNLTGNDVDLLANPSYSFEAKSTDYAQRFRLIFATGNATDDNFAYYSDGTMVINNDGDATLKVYDVTGRMINSQSINGSCQVNLNAPAGVYMIQLVNGNNTKTQKIVVK